MVFPPLSRIRFNGPARCLQARATHDANLTHLVFLIIASFAITACNGDNNPVVDGSGTVARVDVTPPSATVVVDGTVQLTATPRDQDGNVVSGRQASWSSDVPSIAMVDNSGLVSGVSVGATQIEATVDGRTGTATITVDPVLLVADANGVDGVYEGLVDRAITFDGSGSQGSFPIEHYFWDFGDGSDVVDAITPMHTYPANLVPRGFTETFTVTLRVVDSQGNEATATAEAIIGNPY